MTIPEDPWWREFIAALPARTAKCGVVRRDGRPHVSPVWVTFDGDDLVFNTGKTSLKGKAIERDPRVSLCFDDDRPPFSFVIVEGLATISEDPDELRHWATVLGGRYMGADQAEAYGARNGVPGELLARVSPVHVTAARDIAL